MLGVHVANRAFGRDVHKVPPVHSAAKYASAEDFNVLICEIVECLAGYPRLRERFCSRRVEGNEMRGLWRLRWQVLFSRKIDSLPQAIGSQLELASKWRTVTDMTQEDEFASGECRGASDAVATCHQDRV